MDADFCILRPHSALVPAGDTAEVKNRRQCTALGSDRQFVKPLPADDTQPHRTCIRQHYNALFLALWTISRVANKLQLDQRIAFPVTCMFSVPKLERVLPFLRIQNKMTWPHGRTNLAADYHIVQVSCIYSYFRTSETRPSS